MELNQTEDSADPLTELIYTNSFLTLEQARKIARALLTFVDDDEDE